MQKKTFIIHNNDIYDGDNHDLLEFDGIVFVVDAEEIVDIGYEEFHGMHMTFSSRYDVSLCYMYIIDCMGSILAKSKIDGTTLISMEDFINSNNILV